MRTQSSSDLAVKKTMNSKLRAFTLIELLVVIAIISILTALLFPVFATARENARQGATMSHIQAIQNGLALYKLDNHAYPSVLFGYGPQPVTGSGTGTTTATAKPMSDSADVASTTTSQGGSSLYPTYVNNYHDFEAEDNPVDNNLSQTVALTSTELETTAGTCDTTSNPTCTDLKLTPRSFYVMDAFDVSPRIAALGTPNRFANGTAQATLQYVIRYQRDWTNIQPLTAAAGTSGTSGTTPTFASDPYYTNYLHQLRWQNPPANSYVTSTTYHVPNANKIIVLFESGTAVKMDTSQQYGGNPYDDSTSCYNTVGGTNNTACAVDSNGDNPAKFWKVANSQ